MVPELKKTGGTERCVASLGEALVRGGHHVTVFANAKDREILAGAGWYMVPMIRRPHVVRFISFLVGSWIVRSWAKMTRGEYFDVVHSTGPDVLRPTVTTIHACCASFGQRLRLSSAAQGWQRWPKLRRWSNGVAYRVSAACERYVVRKGAQRLIAVSDGIAREIQQVYGVGPERMSVIPNGVDLEEFNSGVRTAAKNVRAELNIPSDAVVVLFVGHNWERKGLSTLVAALSALRSRRPECHVCLVVVGGGGRVSFEENVGRQLGGDVRFLGTRADMAQVYGAADLCVLPTTQEPFGLPVLEAMACGLPVVVSALAGVADAITDGFDGLLLEDPTDLSELVSKLEQLLLDEELRAAVGARAAETARRHSWDAVAERVLDLYREVVGRE